MATDAAHTVEIGDRDAGVLRADVYEPSAPPAGVVILVHGFKGYKTWGFFPHLARQLCGAGLVALAVDLSFNGTYPLPVTESDPERDGSAPMRYVRPDLFRRNTLRREYEDVARVIEYVSHHIAPPAAGLPLGLFGHSRGGIVAVLHALERSVVRALCTWSTTDNPDIFTAHQKEQWRARGRYDFVDARDGTELCVDIDYLNDLEENLEFYAIGARLHDLKVPHLIVHGTQDMVVTVDRALALHEAERGLRDKKLVLIKTGHTFGVSQPVLPADATIPGPLQHATRETVEWFATHLNGGKVV